jgi:H3 lysine-79-specific histone-lysine N-methyltransferase
VAFASTELDKTRRSIEEAHPTSPDSGINQSDHSRAFLSSSSSSSQPDVPPAAKHVVPIIKSSPAETIDVAKFSKFLETSSLCSTSPPLSDVGLPRTPSPSASPPPVAYSAASASKNNHTLKIPLKYQRQSKAIPSEKHFKKKFRERNWEEYEDAGQMPYDLYKQKSAKFRPIPASEHYKKKFRERNWEEMD